VFKRLINFAAGRTIVVPLSGGLDSRLIVLMLKRIGYNNVVAFTYGRRGYRESLISRKVAESLGFRWEFVEYSNDSWRRWYESPEWQAYSTFADGLSSTPHLQEWPAVWELKKNARIPNESIFVPGLTPALTHSIHKPPVQWLKETVISADEVAGTICDRYFTLQDWTNHHGTFRPGLCRKIKTVLQLPAKMAPELAIEVFDRWWLQTTFPNFLVNQVRVYEFWGYEWWLPLCDLEFVRFSTALPLDLQLQKRFELPYVQRVETVTTGKPPASNTSDPSLIPSLLKILNALHIRNQARRIRARLEYDRHHFAWYGLMPERDYMRAFHGKEDINTYLANQTLRKIFPDYAIPDGLDFLA
jgi:asparagine synthase (glutamine-hydrolysing)